MTKKIKTTKMTDNAGLAALKSATLKVGKDGDLFIAPDVILHVDEKVKSVSVRCDALRCLASQSIRLLGSDIFAVNCDASWARFNMRMPNGEVFRFFYPMPLEAQQKIRDWDDGKDVKPFTIRLRGTKNGGGMCAPWKPRPYNRREVGAKTSSGRKKVCGAKQCVRRYAGLRIIEKVGQQPVVAEVVS